jgi:hypothetical protein
MNNPFERYDSLPNYYKTSGIAFYPVTKIYNYLI